MRMLVALFLWCLSSAFAQAQIPNPIAPNQPCVDNSNRIANTHFVHNCAGGGGGGGTVTSVGLSVPAASVFGVTGSPVTGAGTLGLTTSGVSGGIPYFSSTTALGSSALLAANQLVLGGGSATAPATIGSLGTTITVLHGNAAGPPSFGPVANADLVNSSTTVSGQACALGGSCTIPASGLSAIGANTYLGNPTSGSAAPTATVIGSCSGNNHALQYTTNTGLTCATDITNLDVADQTVTGGANVTVLAQSAGNLTVDCGARPAQYIPNTGAFTITAPSNDGYCYLDVENGSGAGAVTPSGFVPNTIGGATLDTTNGHNFRLMVSRVHGHSNIFAVALQ